MHAFITVGSTRFDALVQSVLSQPVLAALGAKGCTTLTVQCGNSEFEFSQHINQDQELSIEREGIRVELWKFKPSLREDYERADLIISHAGSGTILAVLRQGKPLIVIPNPTLLDNHQEELASELSALGYLQCSRVHDLAANIECFNPSTLKAFPPFDGSRFARILDEEMGFV